MEVSFRHTQRILEEGGKSKAEYQAKKKAEALAIEQQPVEPPPGEAPAVAAMTAGIRQFKDNDIVGQISEQTANEINSLGFSTKPSPVIIPQKTIEYIEKSHPELTDDDMAYIQKTIEQPLEILPNIALEGKEYRGNSVIFARRNGKDYVTIVEIAPEFDNNVLWNFWKMDYASADKYLAKFRNEKARILQAGGRPLPHIPLRTKTEGKPEGLSGSQPETPSSIINIPPSAEDVKSAAIRQEAWKEKAFRDNLGHQARLRQRQIDEAFPEEAEPEPLKPVAPRHYGFMEDMITYFEGPSKIKDLEGQVVGRTKSQRPKWLQDATAEAGYKYDDALKIIEKAKTGKPLTEKQQMFFDRLVEVSRRDYERYGRLEIYLDDMQEGDKFIVDGETFTHKGYDDEGNAIIKDGITYKVPAFDRDQKVMVDDYIETPEAGEADTGGYAESINRDRYRGFLADRQKKGLMDTIDEHRLNELLNAYENFPIGGEIVTKLGEKVRFKPSEGKSVDDYVHHFLVKYSKGHNKDFYSQKYLDLVNEIPDTVKNYNDRILGEVDGKERIYYVRKLQADAKRPHHIIVVTTDAAGNFIGWTHFAGKEGYKRNLLFAEKEAVDKYGLVDRKGEIVNLNYEEYANEKRRTLLYLASNAQKAHHKRQESPLPSDEIIPPSEKPVKGSEIEPKDTILDFMGGQQIYEAAVRLVRKISPKAAGNVGVVKKKDDIGIIKALLASPDKMPSIIRYYVVHGKNAVVKQDRLRGIADREMKEIFKPLKSKEQVREFEALAWMGDMEGRNYTAQELDDMGVSATVRDAYLKHRKFHEQAWRLLAAHRKTYGGGTGHREGHIPHFFENWNVYEMVEVTDDEGVASLVPGGIAGTFRSLREATEFANGLSSQKQYLIQPKMFRLPDELVAKTVLKDSSYFKLAKKMENAYGITRDEALDLTREIARRKNRRRFFGSIMKRKGQTGFRQDDLQQILKEYYYSAARYMALDDFKARVVPKFEKDFGVELGRADQALRNKNTARYVQEYINDVNGVPGAIEDLIDASIKKALGSHIRTERPAAWGVVSILVLLEVSFRQGITEHRK